MDVKHFNQEPKREAKFITPPNILKAKVGAGGLNEAIIERAQDVLENHTVDFGPLAEIYLKQFFTSRHSSTGTRHFSDVKSPILSQLFVSREPFVKSSSQTNSHLVESLRRSSFWM